MSGIPPPSTRRERRAEWKAWLRPWAAVLSRVGLICPVDASLYFSSFMHLSLHCLATLPTACSPTFCSSSLRCARCPATPRLRAATASSRPSWRRASACRRRRTRTHPQDEGTLGKPQGGCKLQTAACYLFRLEGKNSDPRFEGKKLRCSPSRCLVLQETSTQVVEGACLLLGSSVAG